MSTTVLPLSLLFKTVLLVFFSIAAILPATLSMFRTFSPSIATIASAKAAADEACLRS